MSDEIRFEWNLRKAASNKIKHGVGFDAAAGVFDDPFVYEYEEGNEYGEVRSRAIGQIGERLVLVSYNSYQDDQGEVVRIISARRATPREIRAYHRHSQNDSRIAPRP
jgi:uncharacterized DUF497 family protein